MTSLSDPKATLREDVRVPTKRTPHCACTNRGGCCFLPPIRAHHGISALERLKPCKQGSYDHHYSCCCHLSLLTRSVCLLNSTHGAEWYLTGSACLRKLFFCFLGGIFAALFILGASNTHNPNHQSPWYSLARQFHSDGIPGIRFVFAGAWGTDAASSQRKSFQSATSYATLHRLCEGLSYGTASPETYLLHANDAQRRTIYARNCSFGAGLILTSNLTLGQEAIPVVNAAVYLIDNYVSGQGLTVNAVLGTGSFIHVINMRPTLGASPPPVSLFGSLLLGAEIAFYSSVVGTVTSSMAVSQCAKLQFLSGTAMFQLTLDANSSLTSSAALVVRGVSVMAPVNSGQAHAIHVGGAVVDSLVEVSGSTLTGDSKACLVFDSGNVSPSSPHYGRHGIGNVLNVTGNTLSVRSSVGGLPSTFVFGVMVPPAGHPSLSHLRSSTLLALSANNITVPSVGGAPSDIPLVHCHSMGALVVHDGANTGSGGRVNFVTDGESPSDIVQGPQLVIRGYASIKAIAVTFRVSVVNPTILIDGCSTAALAVSSALTIMGANVLVSGGSISSSLEIGGGAQLANKSRVAVRVSMTIPSLLFTLSRLVDSMIEIAGCTSPGLSFAFPLEEGAAVMVLDSTLTSSGLRVSTSISGGSLLHVEGNTITSTTTDAVLLSSSITLRSTAAFVGNTLVAAALSNMYAFYVTSEVSSGTVVLARNIGSKGGVYITGDFYTTEAKLAMTGNTFNPSVASSSYIFYLPNWCYGARFVHDSTNKYTGARPFTFRFKNRLGTTVAQTLNVFLSVADSSISTFLFDGVPSTVHNDYNASVVAIDRTTVTSDVSFTLPYAMNINLLVRASTMTTLGLALTQAKSTAFHLKSSTVRNGITMGGSFIDKTSVVFDGLTTNDNQQLAFSFVSSCSASATCLLAIWNTVMKGTNTPVYVGGTIGAYTHIDIFGCNFDTDFGGAWNVIEFASANPSSTASLSVVQSKLYCRDSNMFQDDAYTLSMNTAMVGGLELFASEFHGDGIKATWSASSMAYFHIFKNRIEQGSYGGSARSSGVQACNWCDDFGCGNVGGGSMSGVPSTTCGSTRERCLMTSSFRRASYFENTNTLFPGSCMILPDVASKANFNAATLPQIIFDVSFRGGASGWYTYAEVVSGTLSSALSQFTCTERRDRLVSLWMLFATYPLAINNAVYTQQLFSSVSSCGGVPLNLSTFVPALVFRIDYTAPFASFSQVCYVRPIASMTPTEALARTPTKTQLSPSTPSNSKSKATSPSLTLRNNDALSRTPTTKYEVPTLTPSEERIRSPSLSLTINNRSPTASHAVSASQTTNKLNSDSNTINQSFSVARRKKSRSFTDDGGATTTTTATTLLGLSASLTKIFIKTASHLLLEPSHTKSQEKTEENTRTASLMLERTLTTEKRKSDPTTAPQESSTSASRQTTTATEATEGSTTSGHETTTTTSTAHVKTTATATATFTSEETDSTAPDTSSSSEETKEVTEHPLSSSSKTTTATATTPTTTGLTTADPSVTSVSTSPVPNTSTARPDETQGDGTTNATTTTHLSDSASTTEKGTDTTAITPTNTNDGDDGNGTTTNPSGGEGSRTSHDSSNTQDSSHSSQETSSDPPSSSPSPSDATPSSTTSTTAAASDEATASNQPSAATTATTTTTEATTPTGVVTSADSAETTATTTDGFPTTSSATTTDSDDNDNNNTDGSSKNCTEDLICRGEVSEGHIKNMTAANVTVYSDDFRIESLTKAVLRVFLCKEEDTIFEQSCGGEALPPTTTTTEANGNAHHQHFAGRFPCNSVWRRKANSNNSASISPHCSSSSKNSSTSNANGGSWTARVNFTTSAPLTTPSPREEKEHEKTTVSSSPLPAPPHSSVATTTTVLAVDEYPPRVVFVAKASLSWNSQRCLALVVTVHPSDLSLLDATKGAHARVDAGSPENYGFCPPQKKAFRAASLPSPAFLLIDASLKGPISLSSSSPSDSNATPYHNQFALSAVALVHVLPASLRPESAGRDDEGARRPRKVYNTSAFFAGGFALFDTQSIAVMSQSQCAERTQRERFRSARLLNPTALWTASDGEDDGGISGASAVFGGFFVVICGLGAVFLAVGAAQAACLMLSPSSSSSSSLTDALLIDDDHSITNNEKEEVSHGGGKNKKRKRSFTLWWSLAKLCLASLRVCLLSILVLALYPGAAFTSVRLFAELFSDRSNIDFDKAHAAAVNWNYQRLHEGSAEEDAMGWGSSDAAAGIVGCVVLIVGVCVGVPLFLRLYVTAAWYSLRADATEATVRRARLDLSGGAGVVTKAEFINGNRQRTQRMEATADDDDGEKKIVERLDLRTYVSRFVSFWISPLGLFRTQVVGECLLPLVAWRLPRPWLWSLLPFGSGLTNAVLLGGAAEGSVAPAPLCVGLFGASAAVHCGLALLVAIYRPYTTRAQNALSSAALVLTAVALCISSSSVAVANTADTKNIIINNNNASFSSTPSQIPHEGNTDSLLLPLEGLFIAQFVVVVLRIILEVWLALPHLSGHYRSAVEACACDEHDWRFVGLLDSEGRVEEEEEQDYGVGQNKGGRDDDGLDDGDDDKDLQLVNETRKDQPRISGNNAALYKSKKRRKTPKEKCEECSDGALEVVVVAGCFETSEDEFEENAFGCEEMQAMPGSSRARKNGGTTKQQRNNNKSDSRRLFKRTSSSLSFLCSSSSSSSLFRSSSHSENEFENENKNASVKEGTRGGSKTTSSSSSFASAPVLPNTNDDDGTTSATDDASDRHQTKKSLSLLRRPHSDSYSFDSLQLDLSESESDEDHQQRFGKGSVGSGGNRGRDKKKHEKSRSSSTADDMDLFGSSSSSADSDCSFI